MYRLDLDKAEEPEIKLPTSIGSQKKEENSRKNTFFCFIDYIKAFDCVDHNELWKILKRYENTRLPYMPPEKSACRLRSNSQNQTWNNGLVPNWERSTSRVFIVTLLITYMQNTCEMPGWMKHKPESRLLGEKSTTSDMQMTPHLRQKVKRN